MPDLNPLAASVGELLNNVVTPSVSPNRLAAASYPRHWFQFQGHLATIGVA